MLLRSRMAFSLLAFGAMDSGMGRSSPPSPPTFLGYHWPIHTEAKYQLRWRVQEMHPGVGTLTTSWDPQVIIRTGTIQPEGLAVVIDIQSAEYATTGEGKVTASPAMTLETMSVHAVLTPQGHWKDVQWSVPTNPVLPRSVLTAMLPLSDLLPPIPVGGWPAGKPTDVSFPAGPLEIAGLHVEPRAPVGLEVHIVASAGDGYWTVHSTLSLPSDLPIFFKGPSTPSHPKGLYPGTVTAHRVTRDDLDGHEGGVLIRGEGTWQGTIHTANTGLSNFTARWELTQIGS